MAVGNAIVNTAKFKPLTIAEWGAPLKEYATQHIAAEKALWDVRNNLAEFEHYITSNPDSELARKYKAYIDDVDRLAQILATNGITPQTRTELMNLRREYTGIIKPIKTGIAQYQKAADRRAKNAYKGIIGPDISPETYIHNPEYVDNYTTVDDIAKDATRAFKSLKGYSTDIQEENLGNGYTAFSIPQSYSSEQYLAAFNEEEGAPEEITNTINALRAKYSQFAGEDENIQTLIDYAIKQGAGSSIVNPKVSYRKTGTSTGKGTGIYTNINIPQFKGYTPSTTDEGEILYKKDGSYYRMIPLENGKYLPQAVTNTITIDGKTFVQKSGGNPGALVTESPVSADSEYTRGFTINYSNAGKDSWSLGNFDTNLLKHHTNSRAKIMTYSEAIGNNGLPDRKAKNALTEYVRNQFSALDKTATDNIVVEMIPIDKQHYKIHVLEKNSKYSPKQEEPNSAMQDPLAKSITFGK